MKEKFCGRRRGPGAAAARENWKVGTKQARMETNMGGEADPLALQKGRALEWRRAQGCGRKISGQRGLRTSTTMGGLGGQYIQDLAKEESYYVVLYC